MLLLFNDYLKKNKKTFILNLEKILIYFYFNGKKQLITQIASL